jgi:hypothetical protein
VIKMDYENKLLLFNLLGENKKVEMKKNLPNLIDTHGGSSISSNQFFNL